MRDIRKLLGDLKDVDSYVDGIVVHTQGWEEQLVILQELFQRSYVKLTFREAANVCEWFK